MKTKNRIWEIDFLRGIAILLMIIFHLIVDLNTFFSVNIDYLKGFWAYEGKLSAILFITISGISCSLSRNNLIRGIKVFFIGMAVTAVTYLMNPHLFVRFGILHLLGCSMIIGYLFQKAKSVYITVIGFLFIFAGAFFARIEVETPYFFFLGLMDKNFASLDYYPILPWSGLFLLGMVAGRRLYFMRTSLFREIRVLKAFTFLGRHSLLIYLLHQPLLLGILKLFFI